MTAEERMFQISLDGEMCDVHYFQQISAEKSLLLFNSPWGGAVIRNSREDGKILAFDTVKEFENLHKENNKELWLSLPLKVFRSSNGLFGVYCCPQCDSMSGTETLLVDQDPVQILSRLCIHSKVCSTLIGDWRDIWDIDISPGDRLVRIVCNEEKTCHTFQEKSKDTTLLAATRSHGKVSLLYTVTNKQKSPICTSCVTRKCPHVHSYEKYLENEERHEPVDIPVPNNQERPEENSSDTVSESGGSEQSNDEAVEEGGQAERGKHKKYWVGMFLLLVLMLTKFALF